MTLNVVVSRQTSLQRDRHIDSLRKTRIQRDRQIHKGQVWPASTDQSAEDTLALSDGGHLLQRELSKAQFAGDQRVQCQVPGRPVSSRAHSDWHRHGAGTQTHTHKETETHSE